MSTADARSRFLALHRPGAPLVMPNPWDVGSARLFHALGFEALATTSSGFAGTLGRLDGGVTRDEALAHGDAIAGATPLPVSADLENGFAREPAAVAGTVALARETRLAGCSIEDWGADEPGGLYDPGLARERVAAAAEAAHAGGAGLVLTARAENYLRGRRDLDDTIRRLRSYREAGADVVYAPGVAALPDVEQLVAAVDAPVNVLVLPGGPSVAELASVGVARISVGGALHLVALGAVTEAARELLERGTCGFWDAVRVGRKARDDAFA